MTTENQHRAEGEQTQDRYARLARPRRAFAVSAPPSILLALALSNVDWSDAYAVRLPPSAPRRDPQRWADAIFQAPPPWIRALFGLREVLVRIVGIESGTRVFDTVARSADEVVLGADQSHLAFRVSVLLQHDRVVVTTVVGFRNRRGVAYFIPVRTIPPVIVRTLLTRAARDLTAPT